MMAEQQGGSPAGQANGLSRATLTTSLLLLCGAGLAWTLVSWILARRWPWELYGEAISRADVLKLALGMVAAGGAAVALVVNYRRQQHLERDESGRRDQTRLFTERFGAAAAQLGGEQAAVRLAGVYAMAALADEWSSQQQQCIDVLCGYLRLPFVGEPPLAHSESIVKQWQVEAADGPVQHTETIRYRPGEVQVRRAIVTTITQHLQKDAESSWSKLDFNFDGAVLIDARFRDAVFAGRRLSFVGVEFVGERSSFGGVSFSDGHTSFRGAKFAAERTWFDDATFPGVHISFREVEFLGKATSFDDATFSGETTRFDRAQFSGDRATFDGTVFSGDLTSFDEVEFSCRDTSLDAAFASAEFTNPTRVEWGPIPLRNA